MFGRFATCSRLMIPPNKSTNHNAIYMAIAVATSVSFNARSIDQYIFDECHAGMVSTLWFANTASKEMFLKHVAGIVGEKEVIVTGANIGNNNTQLIDGLRSELFGKVKTGTKIIVIEGATDVAGFQEMVMDLSTDFGSPVFLLNDNLTSTYICDKVICVDEDGEITEEFKPAFF